MLQKWKYDKKSRAQVSANKHHNAWDNKREKLDDTFEELHF
jgi:hypothetical protein